MFNDLSSFGAILSIVIVIAVFFGLGWLLFFLFAIKWWVFALSVIVYFIVSRLNVQLFTYKDGVTQLQNAQYGVAWFPVINVVILLLLLGVFLKREFF